MHKIIFLFLLSLFLTTGFTSAHEVLEIKMTHEKYEPQDLEVHAGETVTFKNVSDKELWPASNIHPTHQIYPEFDPKGPIKPGESWSFTFTRGGEWRYHDHLFPEVTGKITVIGEDNEKVQKHQIGFFTNVKLFFARIYYKIFPGALDKALAKQPMMAMAREANDNFYYWMSLLGGQGVMERILEESGGGATIDCHTEAHQSGRVAYEIYGAKAFSDGDPSCHSGFYHGAMESMLAQEGTSDLSGEIKRICEEFDTSFGIFECLHGVGHGVMAYLEYDLPQAINECKKLWDQFAQSSCYGGAFMENVVAGQGQGAVSGHETKWVKQTDPHFPCNAVSKDATVQQQCYGMQTSWMLTILGNNMKKVVTECKKAVNGMVEMCYQSFGRDVAGNTLRNPIEINSWCEFTRSFDVTAYSACVRGAINVVVDFWGHNLGGQAAETCNALAQDGKNYCYDVLIGRITDVFSEKNTVIRNICPSFSQDQRARCESIPLAG